MDNYNENSINQLKYTIVIPKQLIEQRFIRIKRGTKIPNEKAWTLLEEDYERLEDKSWINKKTGEIYMIEGISYKDEIHNYSYEDIQQYLFYDNYGILTGVNNLSVLDDDSKDGRLSKLFEDNFGQTFRVKSGSGKGFHDYAFIKGMTSKIIFFDPIEKDKDEKPLHLGELQWKGQQIIGAGSIHPSGGIYKVERDLHIIEIDIKDILRVFKDYIIKKDNSKEITEIKKENRTHYEGDNIYDIPIDKVISLSCLKNMCNNSYQGSHPKHGSENTGMNFRVNTNKNVWYCFRCLSGGGTPELIGVMEGIIDCSQAGKKCFTDEQFLQVVKIAREKYELKKPVKIRPISKIAKILQISSIAKKHNLTKCLQCNNNFIFEDAYGYYYCQNCKYGAGLNSFFKLIIKSKKLRGEN